jgi:membrane associated rhomboid family serine protease
MEAAVEGKEINRMSSPPAAPPYDLVEPQQRTNISVTHILVGLNVAVFVLMAISGVSLTNPAQSQLIRWGANWGPLSLGPQPWRVLTSNYVHIGIVHILFNMWCLWSLGQLAERVFDHWTYFLVYTASGVAGSMASLWWHPEVVGAGASGAIFGMAGAVLAVLYFGHLSISREALRPTLKSLLAFVGYNLFFGLRPGVDNSAHLGGLAAGVFLGFVIARGVTSREQLPRVGGTAFVAVAVVLAGSWMTLHKTHPQLDTADLDPDAGPKAIAAYNAHDYEKAIRYLTIYTKQNPKSASAQLMLGGAYLEAKKPQESIPAFRAALEMRPDYALAEEGLGQAYAALGMNQEAQEAYRKAKQMKQ